MTDTKIQTESKIMRFFRKIGMDSIAWPLRRLHCPVEREALVLEVGSGGSPYFRANVLCDAYETSEERFYAPLIHDRPMVISFVEQLPFKDNSFDFVIASHVLEHSAEPEKFLDEIQRVAKAGYIEVPDAFMERLTHYTFHRLEITDKNDELIIRKKRSYIEDPVVVELFQNKTRNIFPRWVSRFPFNFHVRYYWNKKNGIKYKILNPDTLCDWKAPSLSNDLVGQKLTLKGKINKAILHLIRIFLSQNRRNKNINIQQLLQCNQCAGDQFKLVQSVAICTECGNSIKLLSPLQEH